MRVLVVEDEPTVAEAVRAALDGEGHAVDAVPDGLEALSWVETYPYDLLILDVVLPGLDGFALCARVRSAGVAAPILMLTALDEVEDRVTGLDRGADDYLAKPFAMAELLARVRALLRRGASDRTPVIRVGIPSGFNGQPPRTRRRHSTRSAVGSTRSWRFTPVPVRPG